jgi:transcriptional regulator with XRE-family HTH domain
LSDFLDKVLLSRYTLIILTGIDSNMATISDFIEEIRKQRGLSLRGLARESGVDVSTLSRWREGKQVPSPKSCKMLADYLCLPTEHVLSLAGHLRPLHKTDEQVLPEFRDYAQQKYPAELDEDMIAMIEDLIKRRRRRNEQGH